MFRFLQIGASFPVLALAGAVGTFAALAACGSSDSSANGDDIASLSDPVVRGQKYVARRDCASCHGATDGSLSGQDKAQPGTMAYGPNITPDTDTGIGSWSVEQIKTAIRTGVDDEMEQLCETMKRFSDMSDAEASDIAAYLKSLTPVKHAAPESHCAGKP
jgi:mono/diheme cytochrome c family protein